MARVDRKASLQAAYRDTFESPHGKRALADIMMRAGLLEVSTVAGDPYQTHFRDGKRALGLEILHQLRWSEMELLALSQERSADSILAAGEDSALEETPLVETS